jgi:ketosteroid isomerase-like protein
MKYFKEEILNIENICSLAFNRGDLKKILNFFSETISGFSSTKHERFQGKDDLKKTFEFYLSEDEDVSFEIMDPLVEEIGRSVAVCTYYWLVTIDSGSKKIEIPGRASHVYHKIKGQWKIVHEHYSKAH